MVKSKKYVLVKHFEGVPKPSDVKIVEEDLPAIQDGEYLIEAEFLSVDPYMRPYMRHFSVPTVMIGSQVAKIIESKNDKYPVGSKVLANVGWRTHTVISKKLMEGTSVLAKPFLLPEMGGLPSSLSLGVLGMPGNTAYFGFTEICQPKEGETLVVTGAAGAVGSHVGQIGKNVYKMRVVGIAGSDAKCKWLVDDLGFDIAINYKKEDVGKALKNAAPNGIDCYFDNVGGEISTTIMKQMNKFGRISVCGMISTYNENSQDSQVVNGTITPLNFLSNQLKMEGFIVDRWMKDWMTGIEKNLGYIQEGKLIYRETVTKGFENMFKAFCGMLQGENIGKAIVQV